MPLTGKQQQWCPTLPKKFVNVSIESGLCILVIIKFEKSIVLSLRVLTVTCYFKKFQNKNRSMSNKIWYAEF